MPGCARPAGDVRLTEIVKADRAHSERSVRWDFSGTEEIDLDRSSGGVANDARIAAMTVVTDAMTGVMTARTGVMTARTAARTAVCWGVSADPVANPTTRSARHESDCGPCAQSGGLIETQR